MFWNKKKPSNNNSPENNSVPAEEQKPVKPDQALLDLRKEHISKKKGMLPKDSLSREELIQEIEKQLGTRKQGNYNPFETKEDVIYVFFNSNMSSPREVAFEEIKIGGKIFYVNKRFEAGKIIIEDVYASPDIEINLKSEYDNKETTKANLNKINQYILHIKDEITKGNEKYKLLDIEDLKEEKYRLESILESIKYGKSALFKWEHPIKKKPMYMLRYNNGQFRYLKVTENNFVTEENNIRFLKGYNIQKKLEDIANLRITKNLKDIIIAIVVILIFIAISIILFKGMFFEQAKFTEEVQNYCGEQKTYYEDLLLSSAKLKCEVEKVVKDQTPDFDEVR